MSDLPDAPLDSPVKESSGKNSLDVFTFLMTISPKGSVSEQCEKSILKWVHKNTLYAYVVAELGKSGQRHLHLCLCFEQARSKQRLQEDTWKFRVKKFHGDSIGKYAVLPTVMYDHTWYDTYLRKEDGVEVLYNEYDREAVTKYFPSLAVQQHLIETKGKRVVDTFMHDHCMRWSETSYPVRVSGALAYFRDRMYITKDMIAIHDDRRVKQMALSLFRYRTGNISQSMEDDEWLSRVDPIRDSAYSLSVPVGNPVGSQKLWSEKVFKDT